MNCPKCDGETESNIERFKVGELIDAHKKMSIQAEQVGRSSLFDMVDRILDKDLIINAYSFGKQAKGSNKLFHICKRIF